MSKIVSVGVEKDHVESITRANGINALSELIWNALDADATVVDINFTKNYLGNYEVIEVVDNGHGLQYEQAQSVFGKLGGSEKKVKSLSPKGRAYHGKEGKGRYKALALGDLVTFESTYKKNDQNKHFKITINRNELRNSIFNDPIEVSKNDGPPKNRTVC